MNFITSQLQRLPLGQNKKKATTAGSERYKFEKMIQDGKFSKIYTAKDLETGTMVVVKKLDEMLVRTELIENEIAAGQKLRHTNIAKLLNHFEERGHIYLIIEHIPGVDLFEFLQLSEFKPIKESESRKIFAQIVEATEYIHKKGFVHRDLKLENVMLKANHKIKVIDFGLCAHASCDSMLENFLGSVEYACPEILERKPYQGCKAEVWSLGVLLFALLFGQFPFSTYDRERKFNVELTFPNESLVSTSAKDLVSHMLTVDAEKRYSLKDVLKHKWLKQ